MARRIAARSGESAGAKGPKRWSGIEGGLTGEAPQDSEVGSAGAGIVNSSSAIS